MKKGVFWVVATPIGNLLDCPPRALDCLRNASFILAEDTRNSQSLLSHFGIQNRLVSCHEHNEESRLGMVVAELEKANDVAIISDAGTPLISDPGFRLVEALRKRDFFVSPIPGASSLTAALSISGLPTDRFEFFGFFPVKAGAFDGLIEVLLARRGTSVHFESSHRIVATLDKLAAVLPMASKVFLTRELTKKFEESVLLPVEEMSSWIRAAEFRAKGEFVLVISIPKLAPDSLPEQKKIDDLIDAMKAEGLSNKTIVNIVTKAFSVNKKAIYQQVLSAD